MHSGSTSDTFPSLGSLELARTSVLLLRRHGRNPGQITCQTLQLGRTNRRGTQASARSSGRGQHKREASVRETRNAAARSKPDLCQAQCIGKQTGSNQARWARWKCGVSQGTRRRFGRRLLSSREHRRKEDWTEASYAQQTEERLAFLAHDRLLRRSPRVDHRTVCTPVGRPGTSRALGREESQVSVRARRLRRWHNHRYVGRLRDQRSNLDRQLSPGCGSQGRGRRRNVLHAHLGREICQCLPRRAKVQV